jgi:raffinose/stachyose/melibiose transport system substrate-binding protein
MAFGLLMAIALPSSAALSSEGESSLPDLSGVELTYWTATGANDAIKNLIAGFEAETGATVDTIEFPDPFEQNFLTRWTTGERPDFFNFHPNYSWLIRLNPTETLVDLSGEDFVTQTKFGIPEAAGFVDGKHYAAVITYPFLSGMFYNKEVFAEAGIEIPQNLEEFFAACEAFDAAGRGIDFLTVGGGDLWPLQIFPFDLWADDVNDGLIEELNDGTTTFTDPRFVAGIQALQTAIENGCVNSDITTATYDNELTSLIDGKTAMISQATWALPSLVDANGIDAVNEKIGFFPLSMRSPLGSWQVTQGGSFSVPINADSAKQEAALAFIRYATGDGYAQYLEDSGDLPVLEGYDPPTDVPTALLEANEAFLAGAAPAFAMPIKAPYGDFHVYLGEMINGVKTPEQVAEDLQREFERAVETIGG